MTGRRRKAVLLVPLALLALGAAAVKAIALVNPDDVPQRNIQLKGTEIERVSPGGREVTFLKWGHGPGEAGRDGGSESALEGPASFDVDDSGELEVLDQVNRRTSRFSSTGRRLGHRRIPTGTAVDIKKADDDSTFVLDSSRDAAVYEMKKNKVVRTSRLSKKKRDSTRSGAITALSVEGKKASIEFGHEEVLDVTDQTGRSLAPAQQERARFKAGKRLRGAGQRRVVAEEVEADHVTLLVNGPRHPLFRVRIGSRSPIESIVDIQSDRAGTTYVLLHLMKPATNVDASDGADGLALVAFNRSGRAKGQLRMPYDYFADRFREMRVTPRGRIYQMQTTEKGVRIVSWSRLER